MNPPFAVLALAGVYLFQLSQGRLDLLSALVGAAAAALIAFVLYRLRARLAALRDALRQRAATVQTRAMRGHGARYRDTVLAQANSWHLAGHLVPLERVAVMPRFLPLPPPYDPQGEVDEVIEGPFGLVPLVLDYPQTAGVYGLPGTDIQHICRGAPGLALLGPPGSGRSAALALMAILAARQSSAGEEGGLLDEPRTPILFHLGDVDLSPGTVQGEVDPAEILAAAAQRRMSGAAARSAPNVIPPAMAAGVCLVLADGWDELPGPQRARTLEWLKVLMLTYPGNRLVVAGPTRGYGPLVENGLTPVYLLPWSEREFGQLAELWAEAWPEMTASRRQRNDPPAPEVVRRVARGNRARMPLDVTLKAWAAYAGDEKEMGRRAWYDAFIDRMLPVPEGREGLRRLAAEALKPGSGEMLGLPKDEVEAYLDAALAKAGRLAMDTPDFLHEITSKTPLLVERAGGRYAFVHPLIGGFLAAEAAAAAGRVDELRRANGTLEVTMPFLAASSDVTQLVEERLRAEPEVLYDSVLAVAAWAADAPKDTPWRDELLKWLAQTLLAPSQFPVVRERVLAAMVASRDPTMVFVFRQGLNAENPLARALSVLGLGALGDPDLVPDIAGALGDEDASVQVAATLALGVAGGEAATQYLVQLLFEGSELVRRAVAETLATDREVGHQLLREAMEEEDVLVRRAAVYGLARVGEPWALAILEERQIEDDQWFVRDAAREALERFETDSVQRLPKMYPLPEHIDWLVEWATELGENVPPGPQAVEMLIRALQEGDDEIRHAAADALGKVGGWQAVKPLYAALRDDSAIVREAAYRSLAAISQAAGRPLPAVL